MYLHPWLLKLYIFAIINIIFSIYYDTQITMKSQMRKLIYNDFILNYNLNEKVTFSWEYTLTQKNFGKVKRPSSFYLDYNLPKEFQQNSTDSYHNNLTNKINYDRGHLVPSRDMSYSNMSRHQSHYMTNILPQISTFNQGIWLETEIIARKLTKNVSVSVFGGVIFNNTDNDYFLGTHNIRTPDYFYKILIAQNNQMFWFIPNKPNLQELSFYKVTLEQIKKELHINNRTFDHKL